MTIILTYLFLAFLNVAIMLTLKEAILANGMGERTYRWLMLASAVFAPILWAMFIVAVSIDICRIVRKSIKKDAKNLHN